MDARRRSLLQGAAALAAAATLPLRASPGERVRFLAWEEPPLLVVRGRTPSGPAVDLVRAVAGRAGVDSMLEVLPVPRLLRVLEHEPAVAVCITRLAARERAFDWIGEVYQDRFRFISVGPPVHSLAQASALRRVGVRGGTSLHRTLVDAGLINLETVPSEDQNVRKLVAGRIDAWFSNTFTAPARIRDAGFAPEAFRMGSPVADNPLWMAASWRLPASVRALLRRSFKAVARDGSLAAITAPLAVIDAETHAPAGTAMPSPMAAFERR